MINNISGVNPSIKEVQSVVIPPEEHRFEFVDMTQTERVNFKPAERLLQQRRAYLSPITPPPTIHQVILPNDKPTN